MNEIPLRGRFLPYGSLKSALAAQLGILNQIMPMDCWMVTRLIDGEQRVVKALGNQTFKVIDGISWAWEGTLCSKLAAHPEHALYLPDVNQSVYRDLPVPRKNAVRAYFGVPVMLDTRTTLGTICAINAQPKPWREDTDLASIERCVRTIASLVSFQVRIERSMMIADHERQRASLDPLTGIANRLGWEDYANAIEPLLPELGHRAAMAFIDLDDLKLVNDQLGHAHGDVLLKQAVAALRKRLSPQDFIARLGGDEFAVLLMNCSANINGFALELEQGLRQDGIHASVGIARVQETGGLRQALALADKRMYESKLANTKPSASRTL